MQMQKLEFKYLYYPEPNYVAYPIPTIKITYSKGVIQNDVDPKFSILMICLLQSQHSENSYLFAIDHLIQTFNPNYLIEFIIMESKIESWFIDLDLNGFHLMIVYSFLPQILQRFLLIINYTKMELNPINPRPFLDEVTGRWVSVKLKWGWELRGILKSSDAYMNLHILNSEEWVNGENRGSLGEILIRCNNVLYIRQMPDDA